MGELTQQELKRILHYDPETGEFTWKVSRGSTKTGYVAGSITTKGYIIIKINKKIYLAHRLAFLYMHGKFPEDGLQVDHVNQIKDDNKWSNLRIVNNQENAKNRSLDKRNKCGQAGVYLHKKTNKWAAHIRVNGKQKHLGYFDTYEEAVAARKQAEIKYNYHENHGKLKLNQIKEVS